MKEFRFHPGMLVQGPFIECPKCHKTTYGIFEIRGSHFQRKCKECLFVSDAKTSGQYYLPPLDKKVIYLDQFVISNFMKCLNPESNSFMKLQEKEPHWRRLFEKIDILCKLQLITCPSSFFHESESVVTPEMFEASKTMYDLLSSGQSFQHHVTIQNDHLCSAFNAWLKGAEVADFDFGHDVCFSQEINYWAKGVFLTVTRKISQESIDGLIKYRNDVHDDMKLMWEDWLNVKHYDPDDYEKRQLKNFKEFYLRSYFSWLKNFLSVNSASDIEPHMLIPSPAVSLVTALKLKIEETGLNEMQVVLKLKEFFDSDLCSSVPFLKIKTALFKQLYLRASMGQKREPNQGMMNDIDTISTYLPFCDAAFIDNECNSLLQEKEMKAVFGSYKVRVFSQSNLGEFESYLDQLEGSQSTTHRSAIRNLYGDSGPSPFTSLYEKRKDAD
jgi:hypothetical protein